MALGKVRNRFTRVVIGSKAIPLHEIVGDWSASTQWAIILEKRYSDAETPCGSVIVESNLVAGGGVP